MNGINVGLVLLTLVTFVVILLVFMAIKMANQRYTYVVERPGRCYKTLTPGLHFLFPFVNSIRKKTDMREQVVPSPPQPAITSDSINVSIDTVIYCRVTNPIATTYETADPMAAIEQLAVTTLRDIIGAMNMKQALTECDQISGQLRGQLNEATGRWGIHVSHVELKATDPPRSVQDAVEQQMKAERNRHATAPAAEGVKQSAVLMTESEKQSTILRAGGQAQPTVLRAQGEARVILQVFDAVRRGNVDPKFLSYEYIKTLPQIANSSSSKLWIVPAEMTAAPDAVARGFGDHGGDGESGVDFDSTGKIADTLATTALPGVDNALADAKGAADVAIDEAKTSGRQSERHFDPDAEIGQGPATPAPPELQSFNQEGPNRNGTPPTDQ